jgi:F-box associated protein
MVAGKLPNDVISLIVEYLGCWDALQFRQTCREINEIVIRRQTYWYQHFTWFLIKQNKRVALLKTACKRTHIKPPGPTCTLDSSSNKCSNPSHFVFDAPLNRCCIPIDSVDFDPQHQKYIYRFLIHNYRHRRSRAKGFEQSETAADIRNANRKIVKLQLELEKTKKQLETLIDMANEQKLIKSNTVFFGTKSRQYAPK